MTLNLTNICMIIMKLILSFGQQMKCHGKLHHYCIGTGNGRYNPNHKQVNVLIIANKAT